MGSPLGSCCLFDVFNLSCLACIVGSGICSNSSSWDTISLLEGKRVKQGGGKKFPPINPGLSVAAKLLATPESHSSTEHLQQWLTMVC